MASSVSLADFVNAFYTTRLFKLERLILHLLARIPSDDNAARALADGKTDRFSAWTTEGRTETELLMRPVDGRTRSWFMVERSANGTRLYFGSAIVPAMNAAGRSWASRAVYAALLLFHDLYSRALLSAARRRLGG